jgi:perosamine synthetase
MSDIPWWAPLIGGVERDLVIEVLESNFVNDGQVTTGFEGRVAELLGCRHAVAVTSGTCALFAALAAIDIGHGDEVIVPDATFIATVNAVSMTGARPVLTDIEPLSLTLSPGAFRDNITSRTKAVIPVHVSGRAADMTAINAIADEHGLAVVEDAAEAFMSKHGGRYLGTIGRLGCLSFSPLKIVTTGQGGMVITDDDALHQRLRELKDQGRPARSTGVDMTIPSVGYNFKLTNLQAALGIGQLESLERRMETLTQHYRGYAEGLEGIEGIRLPGFRVEDGELPLWTDVLAEWRDDLEAYLRSMGIDCRKFWNPIHTQPCYRSEDGKFPNTISAMPKALWLPSAFSLTNDDIGTVCQAIRDFYNGA